MSGLHPVSGCSNESRKADVVFVHGLGGDAFGTWRDGKAESPCWPNCMGTEFPEVGVWSLGYAASPSRWARVKRVIGRGSRDSGYTMALPDRALQVLDRMIQKGLGERPLLFICHSLGGLLVKQILRKSKDSPDVRRQQVALQTRAVLFLGTPHSGAALATLASRFRVVFGATVSMEDLREHDAHLRDLYDWYRNYAAESHIATASYFETRPVRGMLPIVTPTSAHPGVGDDPIGLDDDHLSIAKPRDREAQVCDAARHLLRRYVLAEKPVLRNESSERPPAAAGTQHEIVVKLDSGALTRNGPTRIPCELPPAAHHFFGRESEIRQLTQRLRAGLSTAVVGPAGLGKTALAANALAAVAGAKAMDLAESPFPDGIVYLDLYVFHGRLEPAWDILANRICGPEFMERRPAQERATEACRGRRVLVVIEGGEEADGRPGCGTVPELLRALSPENRWLLLTRATNQSAAAETVYLTHALGPADAAALLDRLTANRPLKSGIREAVLALLEGHPLALNWAGNLLASPEEDPEALAVDWKRAELPDLRDVQATEHTLRWLFERSTRGLEDRVRRALTAAGLLAPVPFPSTAIAAALGETEDSDGGENAAREALKMLVRRGLLRREESDNWAFTHVLGYRFARQEDTSDPALRQRLAEWLHENVVPALDRGADALTRARLRPLLEHGAALLRTDFDQQLWQPLASGFLYAVSDRIEELGRLDLTGLVLGAVHDWFSRFSRDEARDSYWLHQRCVLIVGRGDVLRAQGDLGGALAAYRESLEVIRRLAEADPSNAGRQRDLSVSQNKVGDVLRAQGDLGGALAAYRESLEVRRRLAEADPSNAGWQRDLSVSQSKVGDVLRERGDLGGALAAYRESLQVSRRLAEADPSNAGWQRDLSVSQERVGDVLRERGDLGGALAAYRESLQVSRRLAEADPSNGGWQRDLSVSQEKIGDVLCARGDLGGALAAYRESLEVSRRLAEADPSNAGWQRDLSVGQNKVGYVLRAQGDLGGALAAYRESLEVRRRLAEADPSNAGWQRDLSYSLTVMAQWHEHGDRAAALSYAEESLRIDERLASLDPTSVIWQRDVAVSRALVNRLRGDSGSSS